MPSVTERELFLGKIVSPNSVILVVNSVNAIRKNNLLQL